jgi:WD40 repeat protein/transcriptional regulator with XRE-family HTH domain
MTGQLVADFAGLLRELRERALLTQEELAEAAGLSPRAVSDLERGIHRTARKDTAVLLAGALGLSGAARELFVAAARGRAPAADVLAAGSGLPAAAGVPGRGAGSPYRGLTAFGEQDAGLFFGREMATTAVVGRMAALLAGAGLLVVSGASGAGKSSLLAAGVLPRLRAAGLAEEPGAAWWPQLVFTPTRAPLDELALQAAALTGADAAGVRRELEAHPEGFALTARQAATARPREPAGAPAAGRTQRRRLVLVVDQFEELFTQCDQEAQRRAFITALHAATTSHGPDQTPAALVVLGVRADFETRCADYPDLAGPVQDRYLVTAMTERQLRLAITEPAKTADSAVDDDLVAVLLAEVANGQPGTTGAGALPLLSHALDQAWRHRAGQTVTLADYERTGGIEGAVAASAQRAYNQLTPAQQTAARQVFTRLAATSTDGIDTADRATRADLTAGKTPAETTDVNQVLEAFAAERLLTLAAGTVELSHEILLTAWPLLRDTWLADTHADRIARTRLRTTAAEWDHHARDPSYLYNGTLLEAATSAAARVGADPARHPPLGPAEREFLQASDRAHHRRTRRRQGLLALLTALVIGLTLVAVLAIRASQQAAHQRDVAISGQLIGQSKLLGDANPGVAKLLSVAAWRLDPSNEARYAMLAAAALPGIRILAGHAGPVESVAFSPDGKTLATGTRKGAVQLWDVATGRLIATPVTGGTGDVSSMAFSPDGNTLAIGGFNGIVRLWDVATHHLDGAPITAYTSAIVAVAFSEDGKTLATGSDGGTVRLWDVATHSPTGAPLTGHANGGFVAFSPDGRILATISGGGDGTVRLRDVATHTLIGAPLTGHNGPLETLAFSPDGNTLATGNGIDGTVRLWSVTAQHPIGAPLTSDNGGVMSLAFSPDGKTLACGGLDGTVRVWDVATRQLIGAPLTGGTGAVWSAAFSPDGITLATGSDDGTTRLWDVATGQPIGGPLTNGPADSVAFSPDGKTLATSGLDGTVRLWDVATGQPIGAPLTTGAGPRGRVAFSPDGTTVAISSGDGTVRLWDVTTHQPIGRALTRPGGSDGAVAFSPDGKTLAIFNTDGTVGLWKVATHQPIGAPVTDGTELVGSVAFSPDGKTLAIGNTNGTVQLWDVATHQPIGRPITGPGSPIGEVDSVAFSPDGKTLADGGFYGTVRLWDVATHQPIGGPLTSANGPILSVAFNPNGKTLAVSGLYGAVQLWDVTTGQPIGAPLTGDNGKAWSVAFSPDGKTLATGSANHSARLWHVAYLVDVVKDLCASAGQQLTPAEWARYVPQGLAYRKVCP